MLIVLLSGCAKQNDIKFSDNYTCCFTDGTISGTLTLSNNTVTFTQFSVNGDTTDMDITVTEEGYTVTVGGMAKNYLFEEDFTCAPIALLGKAILDIHSSDASDYDITLYNDGNIKEINICDSKSYTFTDYS